jgi:hypothetical protein
MTGDDNPTIRIWIRARWRLPSGDSVVRTVRRDVAGDPDDATQVAAAVRLAVARLESEGTALTEGRATLIDLIGTETG